MNPEIKSQWVAALRSGQYKQTKNQLRGGDCDPYDMAEAIRDQCAEVLGKAKGAP